MSNNLAEKFKQKIEQSEISKIPEAEIVSNPQVVQVMEVEVPAGDLELIKKRHEESIRKFPDVTVDKDEYVLLSIGRHGIGLLGIVISCLLLFIVVVSVWILVCFMPNKLGLAQSAKNNLSLIFGSLTLLNLVFGYIGYSTYKSNKFTVTNERAIQWIVSGLFHRKKQIINLESTEDISYIQTGIIQHIFDYGTIRLSTTGDESTYTFVLAKNPAKMVEIIGEIAECARENQPIPDEIFEKAQKMSR